MRLLRLPDKGRIVERELFERLFERFVLIAVDGVQAGEHHGLDLTVSGKRVAHAAMGLRDGIAHLHLRDVLEPRHQVPDLAHAERRKRRLGGSARADLFHQRFGAGGQHANAVALLHLPVHHAHERHHAAIRIEVRVEDERAQRRVGHADGRRHVVHHGLQKIVHAHAGLARGQHRVVGGDGQAVLDLLAHAIRLGSRKVDLVDQRDDLQVGVHGHHRVGHRLRLDALRGVDHQDGSFARSQRTAHLVGEVDMARRVDQVELVGLAVVGRVVHAHSLAFDGDAALALDVHAVEQLLLHIALRHGAGQFQHAIGQRRFAVVDVRDDGEVSYEVRVGGHVLSFKT